MDPSYKAKPLEKADLPKVFTLAKKVFGTESGILKNGWEWYFQKNPARKQLNSKSWVVNKDNAIVAHIYTNPGMISAKGRSIPFIWGGTLMSDSDHRGKGIGKEMVKKWRDEYPFSMALGVGDLAYAIEHSLGWENVPAANARIKILNPKAFVNFAVQKKIPGKGIVALLLSGILKLFFRTKKAEQTVSINAVTKFDNRYSRLWKQFSKQIPFAIKRDKDYLQWKFFNNPSRTFHVFSIENSKTKKLKGYCVLTIMKSSNFTWGRVVEFVVDPSAKQEMQQCISHIINFFADKKCDGIQMYGLLPEHQKMFSKNGFMRMKKMDQRFIIRMEKSPIAGIPKQEFFKKENWFVSAGDSDFTL